MYAIFVHANVGTLLALAMPDTVRTTPWMLELWNDGVEPWSYVSFNECDESASEADLCSGLPHIDWAVVCV